jgi:purine-binding chemotaxis protein CheW
MATNQTDAQTTYLSFMIGDERFAVNVSRVLEVLQKQVVTPVPNSPDYFNGVINFRGEIIPVVDTRVKFNLPVTGYDDKHVIIVIEIQLEKEAIITGAIADRVKDVINISEQEIMPVPRMSNQFRTDFFTGIVKRDEGFILIINFDRLIMSDESLQLVEFTQASAGILAEEANSEAATA